MEAPPDPLVAAARSGDEAAAERLIADHHARIYAFLRRLSGNDEDAADLTQRTFTRVWTSLDRFAGRSTVASWMHGIAHHVYLDWRRADRRGEPQTDDWWASCPDSGPGPADLAASNNLGPASGVAPDSDGFDAGIPDPVGGGAARRHRQGLAPIRSASGRRPLGTGAGTG